MTKNYEVKPCPFCGNLPAPNGLVITMILCQKCGATLYNPDEKNLQQESRE